MFYKVWNTETARFALSTKMDKRAANRAADALEAKTRDMHVVVPA